MRRLIVLLLFPLAGFSQKDTIPKNAEGLYEYTDVVNVDSANADKLYSNAKLFMVTAFKSGKDVTQLNDENSKTVFGNGTSRIIFKGIIGSAVTNYLNFKIYIQCKDGRYKYSIGNFDFQMIYGRSDNHIFLEDEKHLRRNITPGQYKQLISKVTIAMNELISDLKKNMASQTDKTKDW